VGRQEKQEQRGREERGERRRKEGKEWREGRGGGGRERRVEEKGIGEKSEESVDQPKKGSREKEK
jgi:hypothetical protein